MGEHVALLDAAGALPAGQRGHVVGHVQQQVERVEVGQAGAGQLFGQRLDQHTLALQLLQQRGFAVRVIPGLQELVERVVVLGEVDAGVIAQALGDELALGVEVLHTLAGYGHGDHATDDVLLGAIANRCEGA